MRMHHTIVIGAFVAAALAATGEARACGGCFGPTQTVQVVTDHRMVMAIHADESILWDQIRFTGRPEDFSWVLPVHGDVQVELASGVFFDRLDARTAPVLQAPASPCPSRNRSFGGGSAPTAALASNSSDAEMSVQVIRTETVGPYQSVLLRATDGDALTTWLRSNGYAIPAAIEPVVRGYNDLRMDFYAMRLRPGEGVGAMRPVRVRFATPSPVLPLRMIAAGAGDKVGLELLVVGEGRWETQNFPSALVDRDALVWDWAAGASNYNDVFRAAVASAGGRGWVTEYAGPANGWPFSALFGDDADAASDWAVATRGLSTPWVTRLRTELGPRALDRDLQLAAADDQNVSPNIFVSRTRNAPRCVTDDGFYGGTDPARASGISCAASPSSPRGGALAVGVALLALASRARLRPRSYTRTTQGD